MATAAVIATTLIASIGLPIFAKKALTEDSDPVGVDRLHKARGRKVKRPSHAPTRWIDAREDG